MSGLHADTAAGTDRQAVAASLSKYALHRLPEGVEQIVWHEILCGAAEAAAVDPPGAPTVEQQLRQAQGQGQPPWKATSLEV